jgi:hypothetical protein
MDREELLTAVTQDVFAYVMHGSVSERAVTERIKPEGLDRRFTDFRKLVDLHFILRDDVVDFVRALPRHLRDLETSTRTRTSATNGGIDGRVNWQQTFQRRNTQSPGNRALFVCDTRSENYDTDENLVLKHLLSVIYRSLENAETYLERDYAWVNDRWAGGTNLVDELRRVFERNVHVRRIRDPGQHEPTDRMLAGAEESRQAVYREAAQLVQQHDAILEGEPDALRELIASTTITPDDDETLFELFVLFRMIETLERLDEGELDIHTIEAGRQEIAHFEGDKEVVIYHDNSGTDRGLSFVSVPEGKDDARLSRTEAVQRTAHEVAQGYFGEQFRNQTGRPDVIVLEVIDDVAGEHEYLITEVKNSTRTKTIRQGVKETLEYLAFLRMGGDLVYGEGDKRPFFGDGWNGLLVVQDLEETDPTPVEEQETMRILQASEIGDGFEQILGRLL